MFLIVKDISMQSPLLSPAANSYAEKFLEVCERSGFFHVEGQALAYVPIDFADEEEYLGRLSAGRRRDIRRKLRTRADLKLEVLTTGCERLNDPALLEELYAQYLEVYAQSEIHFDLLSAEFFRAVLQDASLNGQLFLYSVGEALIGYNLCFIHNGMLVDKYVGFRYPAARQYNLYFVSWMENLAFARAKGLRYYVAGWTDPEIKSYLGARFKFTRHTVFVRNPVLRFILRRLAGRFESDRKWFDANIHAHATDSGS
jgi:predicted N-acyltransferase